MRSSWKVTIDRIKIAAAATTLLLKSARRKTTPSMANSSTTGSKTHACYSGGLVPDVYHIFVKGQGVLSNASSPSAKAKLRLLFEAAPIALIVEAAADSRVPVQARPQSQ